jgi:peptidoglycan/LPS O-acetylase OafA/YrhL
MKQKYSFLIIVLGLVVFSAGYVSAYLTFSYIPYTAYTDPAMFLSLAIILGGLISLLIKNADKMGWLQISGYYFLACAILLVFLPTSIKIGDPTPTKEVGGIIFGVIYVVYTSTQVIRGILKKNV